MWRFMGSYCKRAIKFPKKLQLRLTLLIAPRRITHEPPSRPTNEHVVPTYYILPKTRQYKYTIIRVYYYTVLLFY